MVTDISFEIIVGGMLLALLPAFIAFAVFLVTYTAFFAIFTGIPTLALGLVLQLLGGGWIGAGPYVSYGLAFALAGIPSGAISYSWFFRTRLH
jgi:hypothetical protein